MAARHFQHVLFFHRHRFYAVNHRYGYSHVVQSAICRENVLPVCLDDADDLHVGGDQFGVGDLFQLNIWVPKLRADKFGASCHRLDHRSRLGHALPYDGRHLAAHALHDLDSSSGIAILTHRTL